jgi:hypothetical protein
MIKITIEKTTIRERKETENFIVKRTPTEYRQRESSYYGGGTEEKVVFAEEHEPREVTKQESATVKLLEQQIENDGDFDLASVIKAVNKL